MINLYILSYIFLPHTTANALFLKENHFFCSHDQQNIHFVSATSQMIRHFHMQNKLIMTNTTPINWIFPEQFVCEFRVSLHSRDGNIGKMKFHHRLYLTTEKICRISLASPFLWHIYVLVQILHILISQSS